MSIFNIFKKKPDEDLIKDKSDSAAAGSTPFPGIAAMGAMVTASSPYSHSQIAQALQGLTLGLSKEEQDQLQELRKEHATATKLVKVNIFKKLPSSIRQQVIDAYEWKIAFETMNASTATKDQKLIDLERKEEMHSMLVHSGLGYKRQQAFDPTAYPGILFTHNQGLPNGLTLEDLKQAHMEASLEEEMLSNG